MPEKRICRWLPLSPGLAVGAAQAAQTEGNFAYFVASIPVLLGVFAILLGARNLRTLRHRHAVPEERWSDHRTPAAEDEDARPGIRR